jgi:uncharacterized glyoxalase superfamily protein PhnB
MKPQFIKTSIILPVGDIYDTTAWYEKVLDMQTDYIHGEGRRGESRAFANFAIMSRDGVEVSFILDEGGPVWTRAGTGYLSLTVRDVDSIYAEIKSRGVPIAEELQNLNWPARGFDIADPSGNVIHIEQPI